MERKELKKYLIIGLIVIGVCLVVRNLSTLAIVVKVTFSAVYPLLLGCIIAYVFNIFLLFCERYYFPKKNTGFIAYSRRPVCLVLALAITAAITALIFNIVVPELVTAVKLISAEIPPFAIKVKDLAISYLKDYPEIQEKISEINFDWQAIMKKAFDFITVGAGGLLTSIAEIISALTLTVTRIVVAVIFAIYLLLRKDRLRADLKRLKNAYLSERVNTMLTKIFHTANSTFRSFFVGQFVEAIILGTLCMLGMTILGFPYAGMTGVVIGVTAIIPIVGAYIGAGVGAFMICTEDPMKALWFLVFILILQQFEGNVIYPKVVGSSIGLPGMWVLAAVTVGGSLFGIAGMLLGVPLVATVYKLYYIMLDERERKLGIVPEKEPLPAAPVKKAKKSNNKNKWRISGKNNK